MFNFSPYGTKKTEEVKEVVKDLNFKGYTFTKGKYDNQNFFIWKKKRGREFLRLCLMCRGYHEERVFFWEIDFNFKPFGKYKCLKWQSEDFKGTAEDLYLSRFLEAIKNIKKYILLKSKEDKEVKLR